MATVQRCGSQDGPQYVRARCAGTLLGPSHSAWLSQSDCKSSPHVLRPIRKAVHNAGVLAREITVNYPFHPLTKQSFIVLSEHEHYGTINLLVRSADGTKHLFPSWMASPEAAEIDIVTIPRLPIGRLLALRRFLDQNMIRLSSEEQVSAGGGKHGQMEGSPDEPVREVPEGGRTAGATTTEGVAVARLVVDGSTRNAERIRGHRTIRGGRS
jgi:Family of unknown function (DUF5372)